MNLRFVISNPPKGVKIVKIGILSDTHGLLRPEAMAALSGCEAILLNPNLLRISQDRESRPPQIVYRGRVIEINPEDGGWHDRMDEVIERCVAIKRDVVAEDEFDTGARAYLNLGHTFGHAIEQCSRLAITHGQGVAVGMLMAAASAGCDDAMVLRLADCLRANGPSTPQRRD